MWKPFLFNASNFQITAISSELQPHNNLRLTHIQSASSSLCENDILLKCQIRQYFGHAELNLAIKPFGWVNISRRKCQIISVKLDLTFRQRQLGPTLWVTHSYSDKIWGQRLCWAGWRRAGTWPVQITGPTSACMHDLNTSKWQMAGEPGRRTDVEEAEDEDVH